jgi:hypothetical protein
MTVTDSPKIVTVLPRGLRPRTPSSSGSLALARPTGDDIASKTVEHP